MLKLLIRCALAVLIVAGAGVAAGSLGWTRMHEAYKGFEGEQFIEIPQGTGSGAIRRRLIERGVIRDELAFRAALWWTGAARSLKAGEYRFEQPASAVQVIDRLERGDVYVRRVTFPEGLTISEMAEIVARGGFGDASEFIAAAADQALVADLDPQATDLEGYLFPDTYALPRGTPPATIVASMVKRFRATYDEELRARAAAQGLTTREVVTLASLVEKETGRPEERTIVAAVYRNRLAIRMPMQADPTVVYALARAKKYDGNIRRRDLDFDSPYNTYKYPGLPPGPIAAPGKASLEAALAPADVSFLYFVSRNDGSHAFAQTLREHNANVHTYQVEYFRRQRAGQRSRGSGGQGAAGQGGRGAGAP
jgi:UPF0755 protein